MFAAERMQISPVARAESSRPAGSMQRSETPGYGRPAARKRSSSSRETGSVGSRVDALALHEARLAHSACSPSTITTLHNDPSREASAATLSANSSETRSPSPHRRGSSRVGHEVVAGTRPRCPRGGTRSRWRCRTTARLRPRTCRTRAGSSGSRELTRSYPARGAGSSNDGLAPRPHVRGRTQPARWKSGDRTDRGFRADSRLAQPASHPPRGRASVPSAR